MSKGYARRKRETKESNPLLDLPQNTVKEMIVSMKALNSAFDNLQKAYEEYKHNMAQDKEIIDESEIEPQVDPLPPAEDPAEYPSAPAEDLEDYPSSPADNNEENSPASVDDNDQYPIPADDLPDDTAGEDEQDGQLEDDVTEPKGEMTDDVNENTEATADVEAPDAPKEEENMNKNKKRNGKGKRRRKGKGKGKKGKGRRRF